MWPPDDLDQLVKGLLAHVAASVGAMWAGATQIFESRTVREAMSKVARCAGAESACELATSMPRWASTWGWIVTVLAATIDALQDPKQDKGGDDDH